MVKHPLSQGRARSEVPVLGIPIIFTGIAVPIIEHALLLGDHTKQVLAKIAGYGP